MSRRMMGHDAVEMSFVSVEAPEGVPLRFAIAPAGDRILAVTLDFFLLHLAMALIALAFYFGLVGVGIMRLDSVLISVFLISWFVIRTFYFLIFEFAWRGQTPGKRWRGLHVIDAHGGALTRDAVVVRNLTREVELFIPLTVLMAAGQLWPGLPGWGRFVALGWMLLLLFMPLFNKHRQRVGDFVAGTLVVLTPKHELLEDLATAPSEEQLTFTHDQLSIYGVYELQVLEDVLRKIDSGRADPNLAGEVAGKIKTKIGWQDGRLPSRQFLEEFYRALRQHQERGMLLGRKRSDKNADYSNT